MTMTRPQHPPAAPFAERRNSQDHAYRTAVLIGAGLGWIDYSIVMCRRALARKDFFVTEARSLQSCVPPVDVVVNGADGMRGPVPISSAGAGDAMGRPRVQAALGLTDHHYSSLTLASISVSLRTMPTRQISDVVLIAVRHQHLGDACHIIG
jgi:hypothetical protein